MSLVSFSQTRFSQVSLQRITLPELQLLAQGRVPAHWAGRFAGGALPPAFVAQRAVQLQTEPGANDIAGAVYSIVEADRIVGSCGFKDAADNGWVEIGYGVAPTCQRRGLGQRGVAALCELAFAHGRVQLVRACIEPDNAASAALAHRLGFVPGLPVTEADGSCVHVWTLKPRQPGHSATARPAKPEATRSA